MRHVTRQRTMLGLLLPAIGLIALLACNDERLFAPAPPRSSPLVPEAPRATVTYEAGPDDSRPGFSGQLEITDHDWGRGLDISMGWRVKYPTIYTLTASGFESKTPVVEANPPLPSGGYAANGRFAVSWRSGVSNYSVLASAGGPAPFYLRALDTVYQVSMPSGSQEDIVRGPPLSTSVRCGPSYGSLCWRYDGVIEYQITRPEASLTFTVDSSTVSTASKVVFTIGASPDSLAGIQTPITIDSAQWIPDPDSLGGDYTEATNAIGFTRRQYTRTIAGSGTLRVVTHVNGRRFIGTQHVGTRDRVMLTAVKSYINTGDTVTFTPTTNDGSPFTMYSWTWKADSTTTPQTRACYPYMNPCKARVYEHGWMTVTVWKNNVKRSARAHVTIGPRPRLRVFASPSAIDSGAFVTFTTSAAGAPYAITHWRYDYDSVAVDPACNSLKQCPFAPVRSGVMHVFGTVDTEPDSAEAAVVVNGSEMCGPADVVAAARAPNTAMSALTLPCTEPPPLEDIGEESDPSLPECAVTQDPDTLTLGYVPATLGEFMLASHSRLPTVWVLGKQHATQALREITLSSENQPEWCALLEEKCYREITAAEGLRIVEQAKSSPEWRYTQGNYHVPDSLRPKEPDKDIPTKYGDCTDFVWYAATQALGSSWPHVWKWRPGTKNYHQRTENNPYGFSDATLLSVGYKRIPASEARPGDTIVRGGHAGIFLGVDAQGRLPGWANNGLPATRDKNNVDGSTGWYDFSTKNGIVPEFFRPMIQVSCPVEPMRNLLLPSA